MRRRSSARPATASCRIATSSGTSPCAACNSSFCCRACAGSILTPFWLRRRRGDGGGDFAAPAAARAPPPPISCGGPPSQPPDAMPTSYGAHPSSDLSPRALHRTASDAPPYSNATPRDSGLSALLPRHLPGEARNDLAPLMHSHNSSRGECLAGLRETSGKPECAWRLKSGRPGMGGLGTRGPSPELQLRCAACDPVLCKLCACKRCRACVRDSGAAARWSVAAAGLLPPGQSALRGVPPHDVGMTMHAGATASPCAACVPCAVATLPAPSNTGSVKASGSCQSRDTSCCPCHAPGGRGGACPSCGRVWVPPQRGEAPRRGVVTCGGTGALGGSTMDPYSHC